MTMPDAKDRVVVEKTISWSTVELFTVYVKWTCDGADRKVAVVTTVNETEAETVRLAIENCLLCYGCDQIRRIIDGMKKEREEKAKNNT